MSTNRPKLRSHIGMNFISPAVSLFTFQLLNANGKAEASVDLRNGVWDRAMTTEQLRIRRPAIIRLAEIHCRKHQS